jgi:Leucine-rich repeat (LRR) protein
MGTFIEQGNIYAFESTSHQESSYELLTSVSEGASLWAVQAIQSIYKKGILTEDLIGNYKDNITREEFAKLSVNLYEYLIDKDVLDNKQNPFSDTQSQDVLDAYHLGIVKGKSSDKFVPNGLVTRQELSTMLFRTIQKAVNDLDDTRSVLKFSDRSVIAKWAEEPIEYMFHYEIVKGINSKEFMPNGNATIETAIVMINRICSKEDIFIRNNFDEFDEIHIGSQGKKVEEVKVLLAEWVKYSNNKLPNSWKKDDIFDMSVSKAIDLFQTENYLCITDTINYETWLFLHDREAWDNPDKEVKFTDIDLENWIRDIVGKNTGKLMISDLQNITELSIADGTKVKDLQGIQYLKNLVILSIYNQDINDYTLINNLHKLKEVTIRGDEINDLSFLKYLPCLTNLDLTKDKINNIDALQGLGDLQVVSLESNNITDLSPLEDCNQLNTLFLLNNQIKDLFPLRNMYAMECLFLSNNLISDLTPLSDLNNLISLDLSNNSITDINAIKDKYNITYLFIDNNKIGSIDAIKSLTKIRGLGISSNYIKDISVLKNFNKLSELRIESNMISDITPIKGATDLYVLYIGDNPIVDIKTVENFSKLGYFSIQNSSIVDISPLSKLKELEFINVTGYDIFSFAKYESVFNKLIENNPNIFIMSNDEVNGFVEFGKSKYYDKYIGLPLSFKDFSDKTIFEKSRKITSFIEEFDFSGTTDYEKVYNIYKYLTMNVKYDWETSDIITNKKLDIINYDRTTYIGALLDNKAICSGYAEAFKLLCDYIGIECYIIIGEVENSTGRGGHAWNIVNIDGKYYQLDSTWDGETSSWSHFLLSDTTMKVKGNRSWEQSKYPTCPIDYK